MGAAFKLSLYILAPTRAIAPGALQPVQSQGTLTGRLPSCLHPKLPPHHGPAPVTRLCLICSLTLGLILTLTCWRMFLAWPQSCLITTDMSDSHLNKTAVLPLLWAGVLGAARAPPGPAGQDLTCQWVGQVGGQLVAAPALGTGHLSGDCRLGWGQRWAQQAHVWAVPDCDAVGLQLRQGPSVKTLAKSSSCRQGSAPTAASLQPGAVGDLFPMASSRTRTTLSCTGSELSIPLTTFPRRADTVGAPTAAYSEPQT